MIKRHYFFGCIIILGIIARVLSIQFYGDKVIGMEWGEIFYAYEKYGILGKAIDGELVPVPNLYMPPLYPFYLISLKYLFPFENNFPLFVLYTHLILSVISIFFFDKILKNFFSNRLSLIGTSIFVFLPINIYSVAQSSSICLQVFLVTMFFFYFLKFYQIENFFNVIMFSLLGGLLMLIRGEFLLTYILTLSFIFYFKKKIKFIVLSILISLIIISPYLIRNYNLTNKIIITQSFGFNLWKGNNLLSKVEGNDKIYDLEMSKEYKNLKHNNLYDINMDQIYKENAISNISSDPKRYLNLYIEKFFSFLFFDLKSSRTNYYNFFHIFPKIALSILSLIGLLMLLKPKENELNYFAYYYLYNIALFSLFFILPRYSLMLVPAQIILTCYLIKKLRPNF